MWVWAWVRVWVRALDAQASVPGRWREDKAWAVGRSTLRGRLEAGWGEAITA